MGYGPYFEIPHVIDGETVTVVMRPVREGDGKTYAKLLEDFTVQQYVSMQGGPTPKDEEGYFERTRTDDASIFWMITLQRGQQEELVGSTSLHLRTGNRLTSGILLANRPLWGKGIAGLTHRLRTWYAFRELGAYAIDSEYVDVNIGSGKALESVGYVESGRQYRAHFTNGRWYDLVSLSAYNPQTVTLLWPNGDLPAEIQAGLKKTQAALEAATKVINPR